MQTDNSEELIEQYIKMENNTSKCAFVYQCNPTLENFDLLMESQSEELFFKKKNSITDRMIKEYKDQIMKYSINSGNIGQILKHRLKAS